MTIVHSTFSITSLQRTEQLTEEEIDLFRKCIDEIAENQEKLQQYENKVEIVHELIEDTTVLEEAGVSIKEASGKSEDPQTEDVHSESTEKINKPEKGVVDGGKCL
ncbi:unnamed protein product, partial [Brenthis ino]